MGALICGFFWEMWNYYSGQMGLPYSGRAVSPHIRDAFAGLRWVRPVRAGAVRLKSLLLPAASPSTWIEPSMIAPLKQESRLISIIASKMK